jgi:hypothetical protein
MGAPKLIVPSDPEEYSFKIEKNVPIAPRRLKTRYPYAILEIGDSFFVPKNTPSQMAGSRQWAQFREPMKVFTLRREGDGCRVWRIQ